MEYIHVPCDLKTGQVIELLSARFVIGRAAQSDLRIDDQRLSRQHTEIVYEAERCWLTDLGSRNGTRLNGERLAEGKRQFLKDGDEIQVGPLLVLRFEDPAATVGASTDLILSPGLWLDVLRREVYLHRRLLESPLPDKQFKLLEILVKHRGEIVSKEQIADHVWPEAQGGVTDQMIDNLVARLRQRLEQIDGEHEYIIRVRNRGLKFVPRQ